MKKYSMLALAVCMANIVTEASDANYANYGYNYITGSQISALRAEQVRSIKQEDLQKLSADLIANLINPNHKNSDIRKTGCIMVREWEQNHKRVEPRLSDYQIINLSDTNISSLSSYDLKNIELTTLRNISPDKLNVCSNKVIDELVAPQLIQENTVMTYSYIIPDTPSLLSDKQILELQPLQFKQLRCDDLHNISEQTFKKLNVEQVNSLSNLCISYLINPGRFVAIQRPQAQNVAYGQPLISKDQFNNLKLEKLTGLSPEVYSQLSNDYTGMLRDEQKRAMYPRCLTPERFAQLTDNELIAFTDEQLKHLNLKQIQALRQEQLQLFKLNQIPAKEQNFRDKVKSIPPVRLRALSCEELNKLLFS